MDGRNSRRIQMKLLDIKKDREAHLAKAESVITTAENGGRALTASESQQVDVFMGIVQTLNSQIAAIESNNTLVKQFPNGMIISEPDGSEPICAALKSVSSTF